MRYLVVSSFIAVMLLQISCGPQATVYRGGNVYTPTTYTNKWVESKIDVDINEDLFNQDISALKAHLSNGVDFNQKSSGMYPVDYATRFNKLKTLQFLLQNKANPNILTSSVGQTPLFSATSAEAVQILLEHGANPEIRDTNNRRAVDVVDQSIRAALSDIPAFALIRKGDLNGYLKTKSSLTKRDYSGNTALHIAAKYNQAKIVSYLIKKGALLNMKNNDDLTALDLVKKEKSNAAKLLSCHQNKYCKSIVAFSRYINNNCSKKSSLKACQAATTKDIHGVFTSERIMAQMADLEYKQSCEKFSYINCYGYTQKYSDSTNTDKARQVLENYKPKGLELFNRVCGIKGNSNTCKQFISNHPGLIEEKKIKQTFAFLNQKCRLAETDWIYQGSQCKAGKAHGVGKAFNVAKNLRYKGHFIDGQRAKGKVYYDDQPMYDGKFSEGKPNGVGVCFYKGDPEKCEYYEGKRIDVLYKQRIAMANQQEQMDKKLAEMKMMQEQQNARISQIQGQVRSGQAQSSNGGSGGIGQQIGDYALKKAGEKVMDKLFDRLF